MGEWKQLLKRCVLKTGSVVNNTFPNNFIINFSVIYYSFYHIINNIILIIMSSSCWLCNTIVLVGNTMYSQQYYKLLG